MNFRRKRLDDAACTTKENWEEFQEASKLRRAKSFPLWSFSRRDSSTHFSLLIPTEWFKNSVAESWGAWECHQFCAREANVFRGPVYQERECIDVAPTYYGKHSRRAENDVTELCLVDDFNSQVCWTLIGWRRMKCGEDWKKLDNVFQENGRACYEETLQKLGEKINIKWEHMLKSRWWWSSG